MYAQHGRIAAIRFNLRELWPHVEQSASRWDVDCRVVAAVVAFEMHARGPIWRTLEAIAARLLLAIGRDQRVERMSLGIAQIQPRHVQYRDRLQSRVRVLLQEVDCIEECTQLLARFCYELELDAAQPQTWPVHSWGQIAHCYCGERRYGEALASAFESIAPKRAFVTAVRYPAYSQVKRSSRWPSTP